MTNAADEAAGPEIEKFASSSGRILGYIVVGAAVVVSLAGLENQGTGAFGLIGFCIAFAALSWITLIRPRVTAHKNGLVLRNMVRDTFLPWATIKSCRAAQTLQIGTRDKIYHGLGLSKSARQSVREQRKPRGGRKMFLGPNLGMGPNKLGNSWLGSESSPSTPPDGAPVIDRARGEQIAGSYFSHAEQRIEILAQQGASKTAGAEPRIVWDPVAIGGLVLAVVAVVLGLLV